jgi:phosphoenolpyruvate carboxykinase (diphosphate)
MFADGVHAIVEAQRQVALEYFQDGSVEDACPPVSAVLHLMAHGSYLGMTGDDPRLRALFTRESVLNSDWYRDRLRCKQAKDTDLWTRHVRSLPEFDQDPEIAKELNIAERLAEARRQLERVSSPRYLTELSGTIGADVSVGQPSDVSEPGTLQAQEAMAR